jgi:hypothetical protein
MQARIGVQVYAIYLDPRRSIRQDRHVQNVWQRNLCVYVCVCVCVCVCVFSMHICVYQRSHIGVREPFALFQNST